MTHLVQLAPVSTGTQPVPSGAPEQGAVLDTFGRVHSDLRISVTDRCNIRCFYCMPEKDATFAPASQLLSDEEIVRFVRAGAEIGFRTVRITGGEPLLRPKLPGLLAKLKAVPGIEDLALTTNAVLLGSSAADLFDAGLDRLNIHVDTLDRARFRELARRDELERVLAGIERALEFPFRSVKLNAVAVKNFSEGDLAPLVRFARERQMQVRFIEFMPLDGPRRWSLDQVLTAAEMIEILAREFGPLTAVESGSPSAPASDYRLEDGYRVGFIATVSQPFCGDCNRLRLTSDGKLRNCLFARQEADVRALLGADSSRGALQTAIRDAVWRKWAGHDLLQPTFTQPERAMYSIGG
jgi:GTP 3',8-cyclase